MMDFLKYLVFKILFGKFSYTFNYFVTQSAKTKFGNKSYLQPCSKLNALNHYNIVVGGGDTFSEFFTDKPIEFQNTPFNLTFRKAYRQKKRLSCYDISKFGDYYWQRLGFRERIFNTGVRLIYHFLDKRFFFGEMFFSDASKLNTDIVALSLLKKYTTERTMPTSNFKITGKNAYIFFEHTGINLSVKYIFIGNEKVNEALKSIVSFKPFGKIEYSSDLEEML
jgi:hypothetical protein